MHFVKVACMGTSLNPCLPLVRLGECGCSHSHAFHSGAADLSELRVYYRTSMGLVNLEFHFSRVLMLFVEVACVSTSLSPCFAHVPHSQACYSGAADFPELRVYSRAPLGLVKLRFYFSRVLMRFVEVACVRTSLNPCLPLVRLSECGGSHACHSGAPDFPELRVYSRTPLSLVKLRFHIGCDIMRFEEVACVSTSLNPSLPLVRLSKSGGSPYHACHSEAPDFSELRVNS